MDRGAARSLGSRASRKRWTKQEEQDRDHQGQREAEGRRDGRRRGGLDHDRDLDRGLVDDGAGEGARVEAGSRRRSDRSRPRHRSIRSRRCRHRCWSSSHGDRTRRRLGGRPLIVRTGSAG